MPALQVRDFPEELYEQLKKCAADQHRSVAQQTIIAVERMIAAHDESCEHANVGLGCDGLPGLGEGSCVAGSLGRCGARDVSRTSNGSCRTSSEPYMFAFATEAMRADRARKRRELRDRIHATRRELPADFPDPSSVLREAREERDACVSELMLEAVSLVSRVDVQ